MIKKFTLSFFWVIANLWLYQNMMAIDKSGGAHFWFLFHRVLLMVSLITMILASIGIIKIAEK